MKFGIREIALLIGIAATYGSDLSTMADDPGLGWHLKTGEFVLNTFTVPLTDPFLSGSPPKTWIADQWLGSLLLYLSYQIGSWPLLHLLALGVFIFTFSFILFNSIQREVGSIGALVGTVIGIKISTIHLVIRPHLFSYLFFSLILIQSLKLLRADRISRTDYLTTSLLFVLWCNIHPSFLAGLATLGLLLFSKSTRSTDALKLLMIGIASTFINPYGTFLHLKLFHLTTSGLPQELFSEWQPLALNSFEGILFIVPVILSLPSLILRKSNRYIGLLWILFAALSLSSVRFLPYFGIVSALPIASTIQLIGERLNIETRNAQQSSIFSYMALFLLLTLSLVLSNRSNLKPSSELYPYNELEELRLAGTTNKPITVVNKINWGGFIIWFGEDRVKPVIDDIAWIHRRTGYKNYKECLERNSCYQLYGTQYSLL